SLERRLPARVPPRGFRKKRSTQPTPREKRLLFRVHGLYAPDPRLGARADPLHRDDPPSPPSPPDCSRAPFPIEASHGSQPLLVPSLAGPVAAKPAGSESPCPPPKRHCVSPQAAGSSVLRQSAPGKKES